MKNLTHVKLTAVLYALDQARLVGACKVEPALLRDAAKAVRVEVTPR